MTTTFFSENSPVSTGLYIKGNFEKVKSSNFSAESAAEKLIKEKAVVRQIIPYAAINKSVDANYKYTVQHGDDKRLNSEGILRVYNIKEAVNIPVGGLLGNWKPSHVGVTLTVENGKWRIDGEEVEYSIQKQEKGMLVALKMLWKFALA